MGYTFFSGLILKYFFPQASNNTKLKPDKKKRLDRIEDHK